MAIAVILIPSVLVLLVNCVSASHFRGAIIYWEPLNTSTVIEGEMSLPVRITFKISWQLNSAEGRRCTNSAVARQQKIGSPVPWTCLTQNCGRRDHRFGDMSYICTSFSKDGDWAHGGKSFVYNFPVNNNNKFFRVGMSPRYQHKCCWIDAVNIDPSIMRLHSEIDFNPRPDNGKLNRSPVTDMIPILPTRRGCKHHLIIPHSDPDFDNVQCRWASAFGLWSDTTNLLNECGAVCNSQLNVSHGAELINEDCEIIWTPTESGLYAVAVQIEDFAPGFPDRPLSETPLQFLINVSHSNLTCAQRPIFQDTPLYPNCFALPEGDTFTFDIFATHVAYPNRTAKFLVTVRPRGMTETSFTCVSGEPGDCRLKKATLTWTPASNQLGQEHALCFLVSDEDGGASDHECIAILTGYEVPKVAIDASTNQSLVSFDVLQMKGKISFSQPIRRPTTPRYIHIYKNDSNPLIEIEEINTSVSMAVEISADKLTVTLSLSGLYEAVTTYYIVVEEGAFVGHEDCAGGGPNAEGVDSWTFTTGECTSNDDSVCHVNAECVEQNCVCQSGFTGDGKTCDDIDECDGLHSCHIKAQCVNTVGSFQCVCNSGYTGKDCVDIDECDLGVHDCDQLATCVNTPGSYRCYCPSGYLLSVDGKNCSDIDECKEGTDDCPFDFTCINTPGSYVCVQEELPTSQPPDPKKCVRQSSIPERVRRALFVLTGTVKKRLIDNQRTGHYGISVSVHWVYKGMFPSNVTLPATVFIDGFVEPAKCGESAEIGDTLLFFTSVANSHTMHVKCLHSRNETLSPVAPVTRSVLKDTVEIVRELESTCKSSKYGCCLDRVTAATGNQSQGCPDYAFEVKDQDPSRKTVQLSSYPVDIMSGLSAYDLLDELPLANKYQCGVLNKVSFERGKHHINLTKPIEKVLDCFTAFPSEYSILGQSMQPEGLTSYLLTLEQSPVHAFAIRFQESYVVFEYREIGSQSKKSIHFDVDLTDGKFHRYAFGVTNSSISLYVNCSLVEERHITGLDPIEFKGDFVVGRKHLGSDTFTGIIEKLLFSPNPSDAAEQCLLYDFYDCRPSYSTNSSILSSFVVDC